jgi:hypothetical protein
MEGFRLLPVAEDLFASSFETEPAMITFSAKLRLWNLGLIFAM